MRPDELPFVVRRSRRISKESSFRRIMRLVPVFILEKTNYKCLPKLVQSDNVSIKTAIDALSAWTDDASSSIKMAIEEEAMSLSADAFALFFFRLFRCFNSSLSRFSPFHLFYVAVSTVMSLVILPEQGLTKVYKIILDPLVFSVQWLQ